jgi:integrase
MLRGVPIRVNLPAAAHDVTFEITSSVGAGKRSGLNHFRLHDLRHSCATLLLIAEENPKVVSERLGHSTIVLTLDTYPHVLPTMQQGATARLEKLLYKKGVA